MIDFGERKDLLVLFILGVLLVLGIFIFSMIMIWSPKEQNESFKVGIVNSEKINITEEYKAYQYVKKLSELYKNEEYEKLYAYLSKDYINYTNATVQTLKQKITNSNLNGQELYIESMDVTSLNDYNDVYVLTVRGKDNDKSMGMVIREKSPRQFDFAFDDFVFYSEPQYTKIVENVQLTINKVKYSTTDTFYDISIKNNTPNTIVLNNGNYGNNCFQLNYLDKTVNSKVILTNDKFNIEPGATIRYEITFNDTSIDYTRITGLTVKNVKLANDKVSDIFFQFD